MAEEDVRVGARGTRIAGALAGDPRERRGAQWELMKYPAKFKGRRSTARRSDRLSLEWIMGSSFASRGAQFADSQEEFKDPGAAFNLE
jgi:hypothetical protein